MSNKDNQTAEETIEQANKKAKDYGYRSMELYCNNCKKKTFHYHAVERGYECTNFCKENNSNLIKKIHDILNPKYMNTEFTWAQVEKALKSIASSTTSEKERNEINSLVSGVENKIADFCLIEKPTEEQCSILITAVSESIESFASQSKESEVTDEEIIKESNSYPIAGGNDDRTRRGGLVSGFIDGAKWMRDLQSKSEWISVEDKLPETGQNVLCLLKNNTFQVCMYGIDKWHPAYNTQHSTKPIYYQPLPPPPETK